MLLETEKERVCINQIVGKDKREAIVEGDVIVNDIKPDVLKVINTNGILCIYKKEVMDDKVKIEGNVNTYIMYLPDSKEDNLRGLTANINFSQAIAMPGSREGN